MRKISIGAIYKRLVNVLHPTWSPACRARTTRADPMRRWTLLPS